MPAGESRRDLVDRHFSACYGHHELIGGLIGRVEPDGVEAVENHDGKPTQALVAVDEPMIANERVEQGSCLTVQVLVGLVSVQDSARSMSGRVQQAHVAHWSDPEVLHESQEVLDREQDRQRPSRSSTSA